MNKENVFVLLMILLLVVRPLLADTNPDDAKTQDALKGNVVDFRDWLMKQLSQFPKTSSSGNSYGSRSYASISSKKSCFTANQFNQVKKSDWVKSQVMDGLSTLSQQLAKTAGTAFALNSAGQLQQYSTLTCIPKTKPV